jgi:alkanesulfonate monooxygenase SsuD/methylene tetrahydromethanopterin reductase-like flavin-dependent oxidoreductase (luciferase family)
VVGSYDQVADRLLSLARLGVSEFVLDLQPAIDEAHRFGHFVRPLLVDRGVAEQPTPEPAGAGHVTSGARAS